MKRMWVFVTVLTVLGLFFFATSQVMASPGDTSLLARTKTPPGQAKAHGKPTNLRGTIAAVDAASLTVTQNDGSTVTVGLTEDTRIKIPSLGRDASVSDLQVGSKVNIHAVQGEDGTLTARMVLVVPGKPALAHHVGTVTDYQPGVSITIEDKKGDTFTYLLTEDTKILPEERANSLAVGSRVTIIAPRDVVNPTLTARGIVVHPEP